MINKTLKLLKYKQIPCINTNERYFKEDLFNEIQFSELYYPIVVDFAKYLIYLIFYTMNLFIEHHKRISYLKNIGSRNGNQG